jgi:DNA-binding NarL/FixJ family response regulator
MMVRASARPAALSELSEREREILTLIAQGLTNAAIAERPALSPKTVRNYIGEIYNKLQVANCVRRFSMRGNLASAER